MKQQNNGFVLFIVLIFTQIFSLMSCIGFASISMKVRAYRDEWQSYQQISIAKQVLRSLETLLLSTGPSCLISPQATPELARKSLSWWVQYSCSGNLRGFRYYYVTENLGKDSCGMIDQGENNSAKIADYYRLTLLGLPEKLSYTKLLLQSTLVKASNDKLPCYGDKHQVTAGHQALRFLL